MRTAIITGITGQDGFYLASYLLNLGYIVVGIKRTTSVPNDARIKLLMPHQNLYIVNGDVTDAFSIQRIIERYQPNEFYHLAAMSHVGKSFKIPKATEQINCGGTLNCLEAIRSIKPDIKFYFASSSEIFGDQLNIMQPAERDIIKLDETSSFMARSPYGASKIYGFNLTRQYRESYNIHACNGILFNHESPLRGEHFVSRKITQGIADIIHNRTDKIVLGNLDACRDFGFAGDYVRAMYMIVNHDNADDFVIATGQTYSVKEFLSLAFNYAGLGNFEPYIEVSEEFYRPSDINILLGDAQKAREVLGWAPRVSFQRMVELMVHHDIEDNPNKKRALIYDALSRKKEVD